MKAILVSLEDRPLVRFLKEANAYKYLLSYMMEGINASLGVALFSVIALLLVDLVPPRFLVVLWAGGGGLAVVTCYRVIRLMNRVVSRADRRPC